MADTDISVILGASLFDDLSDAEKRTAYQCLDGLFLDYRKGENIICEEDIVTNIGIVVSGSITTYKLDSMGNSSLLYTLEPSFIYSLDTCLTPTRISPMFVTAAQDSRVYEFAYDRLTSSSVLDERVRSLMLINAMHVLANENMRRMYKIELLNQRSLRKRILMYLRLIARRKQSAGFVIPFNREQLAQYLGVNRSSLSHELSLMQQEGLLTFLGNKFTLHEEIRE